MELVQIYNQALANPIYMVGILLVGFYLLVKGADWLVDGASSIAKRLGVSDLIIGLTVVAFGTSMPEFVVNMISSGQGNTDLAITNVLGSNIINIFVILGLTALIWPVSSERQSRVMDIPMACLASLLVFLFVIFDNQLAWMEGVLLLLWFAVYMLYLWRQAKHTQPDLEPTDYLVETEEPMSILTAIVLVLIGLAGLSVGGQMCVDGAISAAHMLHVSDAIIGLTVVALGTSLPELATSVIAASKQNSDLALGNCVGSCIFNVFFVLAISSCVHPLPGYDGLWLDALMAVLGPAMVLVFVRYNSEYKISRLAGLMLLLVYAAYLAYRIVDPLNLPV